MKRKNVFIVVSLLALVFIIVGVGLFLLVNSNQNKDNPNSPIVPPVTPVSVPGEGSSEVFQDEDFKLTTIAEGLDTPWGIDFAQDGRIFVTERPGRIRVIEEGELLPESWLDIETIELGESGLFDIALDPDFEDNGYAYTVYTYQDTQNNRVLNRVVRLQEDRETMTGEIDRVLVDDILGGNVHDGGGLRIGPDGKLYLGMGDAGVQELAQELDNPNGKVLRMNLDGTIPDDNPFPGSHIYSYGHRNVQGLAWDPNTGNFFTSEHGPSQGGSRCCRDEVNFTEPTKNYGWPIIIGDETREGMITPIAHSGNSLTWAPGGIEFISQGKLSGSLLVSGLAGQSIYRIIFNENDPTNVVRVDRHFHEQLGRLRNVRQAPDGNIYILTSNKDGRGKPKDGDDKVIRIDLKN